MGGLKALVQLTLQGAAHLPKAIEHIWRQFVCVFDLFIERAPDLAEAKKQTIVCQQFCAHGFSWVAHDARDGNVQQNCLICMCKLVYVIVHDGMICLRKLDQSRNANQKAQCQQPAAMANATPPSRTEERPSQTIRNE